MRKLIWIFLFMHFLLVAGAQIVKECGTPTPLIKPVLTPGKLLRVANQKILYTSPYPLKVFIRVFADNDGSNLAATEANVLRQFENMRGFYQAHDICFMLAGYEVTRNIDLNNMDKDEANDRSQLDGYVLNNCLNIFIHDNLESNSGGLNGTAYAIPNHFLSLVSTAVSSTTNLRNGSLPGFVTHI